MWLLFQTSPYDYTNEEFNLPQGHEDRIRMVDLLPASRHHHEQEDDDSLLPTDWLEHTGGPGTWKSLTMGTTKPNMAIFTLE